MAKWHKPDPCAAIRTYRRTSAHIGSFANPPQLHPEPVLPGFPPMPLNRFTRERSLVQAQPCPYDRSPQTQPFRAWKCLMARRSRDRVCGICATWCHLDEVRRTSLGVLDMRIRTDPGGIHAFDRTSGLNILLDEVRLPPARWSPAPRFVSIALTNACNLRCPYCYAPKHPARVTTAGVLSWASELNLGGCLGIGFGGGEPTLHPEFASICREVTNRTELAVTFTTHGHRLTPRLAADLNGRVNFIRLSMDGLDATYERLRGRSFRAFLDQMRLARQIAPFGINYVVNDETIADLPRAADLVFEECASELLLLPEVPVRNRAGIGTAASLLNDWIAENHTRYRLAISENGTELIDAPLLRPHAGEDPLRAFAHIDASGILRPCAFSGAGVSVNEHGGVLGALTALVRSRNEKEES